MKIKTSITLSEDILKIIDERLTAYKNRSNFIECALREYIYKLKKNEQNARDLAIINKEANRLNKEALHVLSYQFHNDFRT